MSLFQDFLASTNEPVRHHTLTLVGNLAKHSQFFFDDFDKFNVFWALAESFRKSKSNNIKVLKALVYAVGNVSFYSDRY